jgi:hypothetical protein
MSTLANITSLNLSLQTGGAALAVKAVKSVAKPARTVYVFGTADDVAPNFTTVAGALTYANSLSPEAVKPVVIRTYTKANGDYYDLTGLETWAYYAERYIFIESDFVRLNTSTVLPSEFAILPAGQQVWYLAPNGVETLWVGNEDGIAQLVGEKGYRVLKMSLIVGETQIDDYNVIQDDNLLDDDPITPFPGIVEIPIGLNTSLTSVILSSSCGSADANSPVAHDICYLNTTVDGISPALRIFIDTAILQVGPARLTFTAEFHP